MNSNDEKPQWAVDWDAMVSKIPVGTQIEYLGISMVVIHCGASCRDVHVSFDLWGCDDRAVWLPGMIKCEYVDRSGRIRDKCFEVRDGLLLLPGVIKRTRGLLDGI